mgnify:CR=1 FL=1
MKKDNSNLEKKERVVLEKYLKLKEIETKMDKLCLEMSNIRKKYATILNEKINNELKSLEMVNAKFNVNVNKIENQKYNIPCHETSTYKYSDSIENMETEIKALKQREQVLNIATVKNTTKYIKVYELKKGA